MSVGCNLWHHQSNKSSNNIAAFALAATLATFVVVGFALEATTGQPAASANSLLERWGAASLQRQQAHIAGTRTVHELGKGEKGYRRESRGKNCDYRTPSERDLLF
jgi:hypothetical protein